MDARGREASRGRANPEYRWASSVRGLPLPHRVHDVRGKGSLYCNGPNSHGLRELDLVLVVPLLQVGQDDGQGALVKRVVAHGDLVARLRLGLLWDAVCGRSPDRS